MGLIVFFDTIEDLFNKVKTEEDWLFLYGVLLHSLLGDEKFKKAFTGEIPETCQYKQTLQSYYGIWSPKNMEELYFLVTVVFQKLQKIRFGILSDNDMYVSVRYFMMGFKSDGEGTLSFPDCILNPLSYQNGSKQKVYEMECNSILIGSTTNYCLGQEHLNWFTNEISSLRKIGKTPNLYKAIKAFIESLNNFTFYGFDHEQYFRICRNELRDGTFNATITWVNTELRKTGDKNGGFLMIDQKAMEKMKANGKSGVMAAVILRKWFIDSYAHLLSSFYNKHLDGDEWNKLGSFFSGATENSEISVKIFVNNQLFKFANKGKKRCYLRLSSLKDEGTPCILGLLIRLLIPVMAYRRTTLATLEKVLFDMTLVKTVVGSTKRRLRKRSNRGLMVSEQGERLTGFDLWSTNVSSSWIFRAWYFCYKTL